MVFYRDLHCPICARHLLELERLAPEFQNRGVNLIAISSDDAERGKKMADKVGSSGVKFGYGLGLQTARTCGIYISAGRGTTSVGIEDACPLQ